MDKIKVIESYWVVETYPGLYYNGKSLLNIDVCEETPYIDDGERFEKYEDALNVVSLLKQKGTGDYKNTRPILVEYKVKG